MTSQGRVANRFAARPTSGVLGRLVKPNERPSAWTPRRQLLPKPWPLEKDGKPWRRRTRSPSPVAKKSRSKEEREKRRKVPREESGTRDPGAIPTTIKFNQRYYIFVLA